MDSAIDTRKAKRQCWECLKRRLVCDYTMPHCKKCLKRGLKECPGYDAQKPLQWVEPGKITSRERTKPSKHSNLVLPVLQSRPPPMRESSSDTSGSRRTTRSDETDWFEQQELLLMYQKAFADLQSLDQVDQIMMLENRDKIEEVLRKGSKDEASKMLKMEKDPLKGLRRVLRYIRLEKLPTYNLQSDTSEVVQAIQYFNTRVIPENTGPEFALVHNPQIMFFPMSALHLLTPAMHSSFVCIALQHYILRLPPGASKQALVANGPKIWQYRGEAIRELSRRVSDQRTMYSLATITSIVVFLTNELQAQTLPDWRTHIDSLMRIIKIRGGLMKLYRSTFYMHPTVVLFHLVVVASNSTSPADDQVVLAPTLKDELDNAEELYHELFPYCLCPPPVFFFIIRVTHLRREASQAQVLGDDIIDLMLLARGLLSQIEGFLVNDWAQPGDDYVDWLTIGLTYKHAVAVYCIMSLQSSGLLPITPDTIAQLEHHGALLGEHIRTAFAKQRLRRFVSWPLVVAGTEAGYRGEARRKWVEDCCVELARFLGTNCPLNIKAVLRRYWASGTPGWDSCFHKPFAFMF
ncbi:hypothetical protein BU23DRAFT_524363 [Bimuria novae-zelandiae CBS 107.79]|uniref:Zn(2)-C6 fungal-type domain-containing protein n=1 Tax=Bimuria novae-zelandiae CBS 107.79 TaxID=1447943 RepID=A0A6A5VQE1_9PLEO|nr:hypothetical protein BU23DRAFT_524363 [Bimuria novae-zelandiae CBS 107.79]